MCLKVNAEWLYRRTHCGPTVQDIAIMFPPDAVVNMTVHLDPNTHSDGNKKPLSTLTSEVDPMTLFPRYDLAVNVDHVVMNIDELDQFNDEIMASTVNSLQEEYIMSSVSLI